MSNIYRIGHGFDAHRFRRGRKFILGGVEIPYSFGLAGHSDADVVIHSLINALLGAMGKGDIGTHFPDTDPRYKGVSSEKLLGEVLGIMKRAGYKIVNSDLTVLAQRPRLGPHFRRVKRKLARLLGISEETLNLKAATTEKMGWVGRGEGVAATAIVLLSRRIRRRTKG